MNTKIGLRAVETGVAAGIAQDAVARFAREFAALPTDLQKVYASAQGKTGTALIDELARIAAQDQHALGYDRARDVMYRTVDLATGTNAVHEIYTGVAVNGVSGRKVAARHGINAEHLWPHHWGATDIEPHSDLNIIVPSDIKINQYHWHLPFGELDAKRGAAAWTSKPSPTTGEVSRVGFDDLGRLVFEPAPSARRMAADAQLYFFTRYNGEKPVSYATDHFRESLPELLKWHNEIPATERELARGAKVRAEQGNSNPFLDLPSTADLADFTHHPDLAAKPRVRTPQESQAELADWQSFIKDPDAYYRHNKNDADKMLHISRADPQDMRRAS